MDSGPKDHSCLEFEALLEDSLEGQLGGAEAKSLAAHLETCARCREALDAARLTTHLFHAAEPTPDPGPGFARLVMARIREEQKSLKGSFWVPLVSFGWRFAMTASLALVLLVVYAAKSAPQPLSQDVAMTGGGNQELFVDPAAPPVSRDDVFLMVAQSGERSKDRK
jgi:anti-sigma factor RsiW